MRILHDNFLDDSTTVFNVNVPNTAFPIANLTSNILAERTEFDDYIVVDLGSAKNITAVALGNESDAVTIEGNATDSWGGPSFTQLLTEDVTFINETYRYWRIYTNATDTRLGYFFLGTFLQLPPTDGQHINAINNTDIKSFSSNGQSYNTRGIIFNTESITFPEVTKTERDTFQTFYTSADRANNYYIVQFEDNISGYPPYFGTVTEYDPARDIRSFSFNLQIREAK